LYVFMHVGNIEQELVNRVHWTVEAITPLHVDRYECIEAASCQPLSYIVFCNLTLI
jgi:hypothetical protein